MQGSSANVLIEFTACEMIAEWARYCTSAEGWSEDEIMTCNTTWHWSHSTLFHKNKWKKHMFAFSRWRVVLGHGDILFLFYITLLFWGNIPQCSIENFLGGLMIWWLSFASSWNDFVWFYFQEFLPCSTMMSGESLRLTCACMRHSGWLCIAKWVA